MATPDSLRSRLSGCVLGAAIGDALGLPAEGLSPQRSLRYFSRPWQHALVFGHGMVSDDTEHALFVAQALLTEDTDARIFARRLAWKLRGWFLSLPAGMGLATARSCIKLCLGWPAASSGVFSAGNGPAMRSALIGVYFHDKPHERHAFTRAATLLTHTDPKALTGAQAVAEAAAWAVTRSQDALPEVDDLFAMLLALAPQDEEWQALMHGLQATLQKQASVAEYAQGLGLGSGVGGYVYQTVPVALCAWLRHYGDFEATLTSALDCGGDTDTVGAIAGALAGATAGGNALPAAWLDPICDWPRSTALLSNVGSRLAEQKAAGHPLGPVQYFWPAVILRNLVFLVIVLAHGFRRLLPPY